MNPRDRLLSTLGGNLEARILENGTPDQVETAARSQPDWTLGDSWRSALTDV
jgi:hypothetical protein